MYIQLLSAACYVTNSSHSLIHRSKKLEQTKLEEVVDRQKWDMTMYLGPSRQACAGDSVLVQEENLASPTTVGHLGSV